LDAVYRAAGRRVKKPYEHMVHVAGHLQFFITEIRWGHAIIRR
jgi:hypothetical protein